MMELYLRDLCEDLQAETLEIWRNAGRDDLIKAIDKGLDVCVGVVDTSRPRVVE